MVAAADNNVTVLYTSDFDDITDAMQAIAGSSPCHFTNGIYARQELPLRQTLLAGFRYMMDREISDPANPPALVVAVNSDKSVKNYGMTKGAPFPTFEERVKFIGSALRLLEPDSQVIFFPYDDQTPAGIYKALSNAGIHMRSIHKHAGYGQGTGFPSIPGEENFEITACFPLLHEQKALYEHKTEHGKRAQILADLYSNNNDMEMAYLSADAQSPRILFRAPVALLSHMGQFVIPQPTPFTLQPA